MRQLLFVLMFVVCGYSVSAKDGYKIHVKYLDVQDSLVYLCNYYGKELNVYKADSAKLDAQGEATFTSTKKITGGIYCLLLADHSSNIEFILNNGDEFTMTTQKSDVFNSTKFKGVSENESFYSYQRFLQKYGAEYKKIEEEFKDCSSKSDSDKVSKKLELKGKELDTYRESLSAKAPKSFLAKLFDALYTAPIVHDYPTLPDGSKDSSYPRNHFKAHYWDRFDFQDDRLIYSPLFEKKLDFYMNKLVIPIPDSVNHESDMLLAKSKGTQDVFKFTLHWLTYWTETSKVMGLDESFVYLVENYHMKGLSPWLDSTQLAKMIKRAQDIAPNVLGKPALDLRMVDSTNKNTIALSSVKADYTLLIFWSPTCGHCQKELPKFDSLYHAFLKKYNVKIYAVESDDEEEKWKKFIQDNKLKEGWLHVHDPNHVTNFRSFYDVYSTPTIYLLDANKIIVGKRFGVAELPGLIEWLDKKKRREEEKKKGAK